MPINLETVFTPITNSTRADDKDLKKFDETLNSFINEKFGDKDDDRSKGLEREMKSFMADQRNALENGSLHNLNSVYGKLMNVNGDLKNQLQAMLDKLIIRYEEIQAAEKKKEVVEKGGVDLTPTNYSASSNSNKADIDFAKVASTLLNAFDEFADIVRKFKTKAFDASGKEVDSSNNAEPKIFQFSPEDFAKAAPSMEEKHQKFNEHGFRSHAKTHTAKDENGQDVHATIFVVHLPSDFKMDDFYKMDREQVQEALKARQERKSDEPIKEIPHFMVVGSMHPTKMAEFLAKEIENGFKDMGEKVVNGIGAVVNEAGGLAADAKEGLGNVMKFAQRYSHENNRGGSDNQR